MHGGGVVLDSGGGVGGLPDRKKQEIVGVLQKELEVHVKSAQAKVRKSGDVARLSADEEFACSAFSGVPVRLNSVPGGGLSADLTVPCRVLIVGGRIIVSQNPKPGREPAPSSLPAVNSGHPAFSGVGGMPTVSQFDGKPLVEFAHLTEAYRK